MPNIIKYVFNDYLNTWQVKKGSGPTTPEPYDLSDLAYGSGSSKSGNSTSSIKRTISPPLSTEEKMKILSRRMAEKARETIPVSEIQ